MISFRSVTKVVNPLWIHDGPHSQLITAYFVSYYPSLKRNIFRGSFFYVSIVTLYVSYLMHGFFFNFFSSVDWPKLAYFFGYHPKLPFLVKIIKFMVSCAVIEVFSARCFVLYLHLTRGKLNKLFALEPHADEGFRRTLMKWTDFFCLANSYIGIIMCPISFLYGISEADGPGKLIAIGLMLISWPEARFAPCELYVLYSYMILLVHIVLKFSVRVVAKTRKFVTDGLMGDYEVKSIKIEYDSIIKMIGEAKSFIAFITGAANFMGVLIMALTWFLFFEIADSIFLIAVKWLLFSIGFYYSIRVYLISAYLSRVQSESKKMYSNLNSLIAREKVNLVSRKTLLFIIENISGRKNRMAFNDTVGTIVEQLDVLKSIFATLELLLLGFTFKNNM